MAINNSRSMNADLRLGATDGSYKSLTPSRGGEVETDEPAKRAIVDSEAYPVMHGYQNRSPLAEHQPYLN